MIIGTQWGIEVSARFLRRPDENIPLPETEAERRARIEHERALIEEAREELANGHGITGEEARDLIRAFREGRSFPIPDTSKKTEAR